MEFKDYYAALGVAPDATQDEIKRAYRKLARKYHPDVSKERDAEARFKELAEAYEAIGDAEKRAAYDEVGKRHRRGQAFNPPPGWNEGFEFSGAGGMGNTRDDGLGGAEPFDHSAFFEALFGRQAGRARGAGGHRPEPPQSGSDHHAKVQIDLKDAYTGARRSIMLRVPHADAQGRVTFKDRQLDVNIPKGIRSGQHLRLAGQGMPGVDLGSGAAPPGDLYLEIEFAPHPLFQVEGRDVTLRLPVAPWEAALGAAVTVPTPDGSVQLTVPAGSAAGRKLRLRGKGVPGADAATAAGDLYVVLSIVVPPAESVAAQEAYRALARSFAGFDPRQSLEGA